MGMRTIWRLPPRIWRTMSSERIKGPSLRRRQHQQPGTEEIGLVDQLLGGFCSFLEAILAGGDVDVHDPAHHALDSVLYLSVHSYPFPRLLAIHSSSASRSKRRSLPGVRQ